MASNSAAVLSATTLQGFLEQLGTTEISHSGRNLYGHLCGVHSILCAWDQPDDVCKAGMFHSIYSTEKFHHATLSVTEDRPRLQAAIGEAAERLVYLFAALSRDAIFESANSCGRSSVASAMIPCHWDETVFETVSGAELARLVVLHMANRMEQASKPATGIGFWLYRMSELSKDLRALSYELPKPVASLGAITPDDERRLHSLYLQGLALLKSGDASGALTYLDTACRDCGLVGEPYLMAAVAYRLLEDSQAAQQAASKGIAILKSWGAPWHKHLSLEGWCRFADLISDDAPIKEIKSVLGEMSRAHDRAQDLVVLESAADSYGVDPSITVPAAAASRFFSYIKQVQNHRSNGAIKWYPGLSRQSWYDPERFPVARRLESHFAEIKAEALKLESAYYFEEAENIGRIGSWQVSMFYEQGRRNDAICDRCPSAAAILDSDDSIRRTSGLIYLSKMLPHTHVAAHQARSNIRLRCHLALTIPPGDCAIRVGGEVHHWEEGKCIVFDDTFEHEVWNRTDQERLVLLIDLWHPDLSPFERDALDTVNWLSFNIARGMQGTWQRNDGQRETEGKFAVNQSLDLFD